MPNDDKSKLLIAAMLHDDLLFGEVMSRAPKEVFSETEYNLFLSECKLFYKTYKKCPTKAEFDAFSDTTKYSFGSYVFMAKPEIDRDVARDSFYKFSRAKQVLDLMEATTRRMDAKLDFDMDALINSLREISQNTKAADSDTIILTSDNLIQLYREARDFRIEGARPLVFRNITDLLQGGIAPGELLIYIAASNRGKTLYMVNEFQNSLMLGEKVLYVSMENKGSSILGRIFDRSLLATKGEQRKNPEVSEKILRRQFAKVQPPVITYQQANGFSVDDLDMFIDAQEQQSGVKFDRVIIDYMNKMKRRKEREKWDEERRLTDDLRALGLARGARIITAAQTNRSGTGVGKEGRDQSVSEEMLQGGFGQFETADIVLGYSETPEEKQAGIGRVAILKARESGGRGREFTVNMAPWIGLITDDVSSLIPIDRQPGLLSNPDTKYGTISGLHAKKEGKGEKPKKSGSSARSGVTV